MLTGWSSDVVSVVILGRTDGATTGAGVDEEPVGLGPRPFEASLKLAGTMLRGVGVARPGVAFVYEGRGEAALPTAPRCFGRCN